MGVDHLGNGRMLVTLSGAEIYSVQAGVPGPALCSLSLRCHGQAHTQTDPATGVRTCDVRSEKNRLYFTDFIHPDLPVFVRQMEAYDTVALHLSTPPFVRREIYTGAGQTQILLFAPRGISYGAFRAAQEDTILTLTLRGKATPDGTGGILVRTGTSELIICCGTASEDMITAYHPPQSDAVYERVLACSLPALRDRRTREYIFTQSGAGGVLHDGVNGECLIFEQPEAVKAFCAARLFWRARAAINFLIKGYEQNGFIPWSSDGDGVPVRRGAFPAAKSAAYPILCAKAYYDATGDKNYLRANLASLAAITVEQAGLVRAGHLPFNGNEFSDDPVSGFSLLAGSRGSDRLFLDSCDALRALLAVVPVKVKGIAALARARDAVAAAQTDYSDGDDLCSAPIRRDHVRAPRVMNTYCEACADAHRTTLEQLCVRGRHGRYLCPLCYASETGG